MQLRARSHLLKSNWHRKKQTRRNGGFVRSGLLFLERILCAIGFSAAGCFFAQELRSHSIKRRCTELGLAQLFVGAHLMRDWNYPIAAELLAD